MIFFSDKINSNQNPNLTTIEKESELPIYKILSSRSNLSKNNQSSNSINKNNQKLNNIQENVKNTDSFKNKVQINDYDLLKTKSNFNSNACLQEKNNSKIAKFGTNENFYSNEKEVEAFNYQKYQEDLVYKKLVQSDDDNKYAVNNDSYISHEEFGLFNFNYIQEKFFSKKLMQENKKEKIIEELRDKLFYLLFKSKVYYLDLICKFFVFLIFDKILNL